MSIVHLTRVFRKDVETRFGIKPKVSIQTQEHGDKWLSTFKTKGTEDWGEGMEVAVNIIEKGDFINFDPILKPGSMANGAPSNLESRVKKLEDKVFGVSEPEMEGEEDGLDAEF